MFEDLTALEAKNSLTRREFVVTTLATGFALAVQPISAQTITTDTDGLIAGEVKISVAGGEIPGYRAMPATGRTFPVVLVVQEIFGVHEHIKDAGIPQDTIEKMRAAVKAAGGKSEIVVYPDAGHGFNADYRPGYDKSAAQDGMRRLQEWFKKHGAA